MMANLNDPCLGLHTLTMLANWTSDSICSLQLRAANTTIQKELQVTTSVISMTMGILTNSLACFILLKAYRRRRIHLKSKATFFVFASSLVITNLLGHLITGSLVVYVYSSDKDWESFDPHNRLCDLFGVSMVFFGLSPLFLGSAMAVERCMAITRPLFHNVLDTHHTKKLLGLSWLLAALVAILPVLLRKPYQIQWPRSWCFFRMEGKRDRLDVFLPLLFSTLGLLAMMLSIVSNTLTSRTLLQSRLRRKQHSTGGTSYDLEMICQLLAIMLLSCVCWGPLLICTFILSIQTKDKPAPFSLLPAVRMATWNQILDPWTYILLRKAVLRNVLLLLPQRWRCNIPLCSVEEVSMRLRPNCQGMIQRPDTEIKTISTEVTVAQSVVLSLHS